MAFKTNIFVTGATGYIGGSVVARLLEHPNASAFQITALVRSSDKAAKLESVGVRAVVGSLGELDKLEKLTSGADVVISTADCDDLDAMKAILKGLKTRHDTGTTGNVPTLIHTSGTGVLIDHAKGMFAYDTIYSDNDIEQIESIAPTQPHRNVDLEIVEADGEGYVKTYIILPSTIYGIATGKLVGIGAQHPYSQQIPTLIKASLARGQAGVVGEGKNIWPNVHIDEIADLYMILYSSIVENPATGHGRAGFYFGENDEHTLYEVSKAISGAMLALGKGKTLEPTPFTEEEYKRDPRLVYLGTNSRCRGNRSRSIGWKPVKTTKDMLASIKPEVEAVLSML
jgi:nucleoside-diphosphate-sugar epimerase